MGFPFSLIGPGFKQEAEIQDSTPLLSPPGWSPKPNDPRKGLALLALQDTVADWPVPQEQIMAVVMSLAGREVFRGLAAT